MAIALYHLERDPRCEKVRLALEIEGVIYESLEIDPADRSEVRAISGQDDVPVLVETDGTVLVDSNRILQHLAGAQDSRLLPSSRRDKALTWVLVDRADAILAPLCDRLERRTDADGQPLSEDEMRVLRRRLEDELEVLEGILERGPFLFGNHPTVADVATHAFLNRLPRQEVASLIEDQPRVFGWYGRVLEAAGRSGRAGGGGR